MTGDPTFRELLRRVSVTALECLSHDQPASERVMATLGLPAPDAGFGFQGARPAGATFQVDPVPVDLDPGCALGLSVTFDGQRLSGFWQYPPGSIDSQSAHSWPERLLALLEAAANAPDLPLSRLVATDED